MTTEIITGSFSTGFEVTTIQRVDERSVDFRELVMDYAEELGFTDADVERELRLLLELLRVRQEDAQDAEELRRRRATAIRQPR